ncbi:MAG: class I SAM-dependent methyltransferase, partial [Rikenellaceae bacterium]
MTSEIEKYICDHINEQDPLLVELTRKTNLRVLQPRMLSGHIQGELLSMLTAMVNPSQVLELGTFTGYSAICIARALGDHALLHTIEQHDELEGIASEFFVKADLHHKIQQHFGDALTVMDSFTEPFDLVFMDADKREYDKYYNKLFDKGLLKVGSVIIADNTL